MNIELLSHRLCPFVHRAAIVLHEKGVAFERRDIDLKNKPDWFLALSPRGKVPVLVADGEALFESAAICEFLDETHPPALLRPEPFERARQRAWVEVANDLVSAQFKLLVAADPAGLDAARTELDGILGRFEDALARGVIGETGFDFVHIAVAPVLQRFVVLSDLRGIDLLTRTPRLSALARRLAERPSVAETVAAPFGIEFLEAMAARGGLLLAARDAGGPGGDTPPTR
jgi:glutathione S-transferase